MSFIQHYDTKDFTFGVFQGNKLYSWHEAISQTPKLGSPDRFCYACVASMRNVHITIDIETLIPAQWFVVCLAHNRRELKVQFSNEEAPVCLYIHKD